MQYRTDPKSGNQLSALGFGCMRLPRGISGIDIDKSAALIQSAVERGVNYFDTAYIYPGSEAALGQIFRSHANLRDQIFLATKLPFRRVKRYEDFDKLFNIQLERLGTGYIDYYLIHSLATVKEWEGLVALGAERWIGAQKAAGRIRQIGFSFHGSQAEFLKLLERCPWDFTMIQYNYSNETYQAGRAGLQKAAAMGLPVIVMEPLLGGKLAAGLPKKAAALLERAVPGRSPAAWAVRWLWDQPEVTVVLSGMNGMAQLDDNIQTAEAALPGCLNDGERAIYPQVQEIFRESYKIPCTGCNYCLPCPKGVNIPGCLAAYNASYAINLRAGFQQYSTSANLAGYETYMGAHNCTACGTCVRKCPQHIDIPAGLKRVGRRLEPGAVRLGIKIFKMMQRAP